MEKLMKKLWQDMGKPMEQLQVTANALGRYGKAHGVAISAVTAQVAHSFTIFPSLLF